MSAFLFFSKKIKREGFEGAAAPGPQGNPSLSAKK
jgi:hypothetical protein